MEQNEEKRDRVDLKFMFYAGLRKWKAMIIAGLIIAVLLGIYAIYPALLRQTMIMQIGIK